MWKNSKYFTLDTLPSSYTSRLNSPFLLCGLCIMTSFQRVKYGNWEESNSTEVKSDKGGWAACLLHVTWCPGWDPETEEHQGKAKLPWSVETWFQQGLPEKHIALPKECTWDRDQESICPPILSFSLSNIVQMGHYGQILSKCNALTCPGLCMLQNGPMEPPWVLDMVMARKNF